MARAVLCLGGMTETFEGPERVAERKRVGPWLGSAVLLFVVAAISWAWVKGAEARALGKVLPAQRAALYARELEGFQILCGAPPHEDALQERCREKAEFLLEFPECHGGECEALARRNLVHATR